MMKMSKGHFKKYIKCFANSLKRFLITFSKQQKVLSLVYLVNYE